MTVSKFYFQKAVPVWEEGQDKTMDYTLEFKAQLQGRDGRCNRNVVGTYHPYSQL